MKTEIVAAILIVASIVVALVACYANMRRQEEENIERLKEKGILIEPR